VLYVGFTFILLAFALRAKWLRWKPIAIREGLALAGILAVLVPVTVASGLTTGHFSPFPRSGSVNLYLGNNPDTDRTMSIRPGAEWSHLLSKPLRDGQEGEKAYRQYFTDRVSEYAVSQPGSFAAGLAGKTLLFFSTREIPRNFDIYTVAGYSRLLSLLTWKVWRFGFPFGVFLPFAVYGLYVHRRRFPYSYWFFIFLYPAAVILVFSASRLRAPLIPVTCASRSGGCSRAHILCPVDR